ncbi:gamma-glutamyl-gamma-aminobutyrate hydrolase family protein [Actinoplanes bogorensis]|uniref:Gamma-glutamyl-gamma-aminobutyrate hydrolase family protein n=1 Tax=Paractinoplanes bogorensis TaxID=1610840 RepID=A0ABS5YV61_9ACTN|nr:type 1 glutamine amidotransferase [Actinoplanes bogorensis]MBU2667334.1 gamma-glutamyl-gamma-aminobutyrate hydrolase family protein [Actinoplanes bogorensis]
MGDRPLIVIPARFSASASALRYAAEVTARKLVEAVYAAGGEPLVVHPADPDSIRERFGMADGFLLPGGGDLAAHWSGQRAHHSEYDVDEAQDAFDLAVARAALEDAKPLLAICRGLQVVNVARGGDLVPDLGGAHRHLVHSIGVRENSPLRHAVGAPELIVSCYHHQGIARLGDGLRAAAYAEDGTIEAVTLDEHRGWFLGVQWHPEDTAATDPLQAGLFTRLVEESRLGAPAR